MFSEPPCEISVFPTLQSSTRKISHPQHHLPLAGPAKMFRVQLAHFAVAEALAKNVEHLPDLLRVVPLAAHARAEFADVEFSAAHVPHRAENAVELLRKIHLQPVGEDVLHAVRQ